MRVIRHLAAMSAVALTLAGPLAAAAHADDPTDPASATESQARAQVWITAPSPGGIVRGDEVDLQVYFDAATSCYGDGDSAQWSVDGVPVSDPATPGGEEASDGPGLPTGDYTTDDEDFDSTTVPDGPHTLGLTFSGTDCATGEPYQLTKSIPVTVNNAPIAISFDRAAGSVVSGSAAPIRVRTQDPGATVTEVDFAGRGVAPGDGGPSTTFDADDLPNGPYVVTASASDDADVTTSASLKLVVANHSTFHLAVAHRRLTIASSAAERSRQSVIVQRRVGKHWLPAATFLLDAHGRGTATLSRGGSYRVVASSATMWPGISPSLRLR